MGEFNLKNRDNLIADLARILCNGKERGGNREFHTIPLVNLKVTLYKGKTKLYEILGAQIALQYLVDDIYWDQDNNWSEADRLTVEVY